MRPPQKAALNLWMMFNRSVIMAPGNIVFRILPLIRQAKELEAEGLKQILHIRRQIETMKAELDKSYKRLFYKMNRVTVTIFLKLAAMGFSKRDFSRNLVDTLLILSSNCSYDLLSSAFKVSISLEI